MLSAFVYIGLAHRVSRDGGKVDTLGFRNADLWVAVGFVTYFVLIISGSFNAPQHDVSEAQIVRGAGLYIMIVAGLAVFLQLRGINPWRQLGVTRLNPLLCLVIAAGLMFCAHPLILLTEDFTIQAMHGKAQPQNIIEFFLDASQRSDRKAMWLMFALAAVIAPVAEETLFRGYLYGVLKRYMGGIGAGLLTAGLFAAMHLNLAALPALFVLALCLTLAYEATGSLLVNIFMHGLFNLSSLVLIMLTSGHNPPS